MKARKVRFVHYRFQVLPVSRLQLQMFGEDSLEQLLARKNELFAEAVLSVEDFRLTRSAAKHKVEYCGPDAIVLRVAALRHVVLDTPDFAEETVDTWPKVTVVFLLDADRQDVLIEVNTSAFRGTHTLAHAIEEETNRALEPKGLTCNIAPLFDAQEFWAMVSTYRSRITKAEFHLVTPNMSRISQTVGAHIKELGKKTNAEYLDMTLSSNRGSALELDEDDPEVRSIVDYASQGGGDITLTIQGLSRKKSTTRQHSELSIDEVHLTVGSESGGKALSALLSHLVSLRS